MSAQKDIYVYMDWFEYEEPIVMIICAIMVLYLIKKGGSFHRLMILTRMNLVQG